jgi:hypothetical protein
MKLVGDRFQWVPNPLLQMSADQQWEINQRSALGIQTMPRGGKRPGAGRPKKKKSNTSL